MAQDQMAQLVKINFAAFVCGPFVTANLGRQPDKRSLEPDDWGHPPMIGATHGPGHLRPGMLVEVWLRRILV